jgi:hypothetical protein
MALRSFKDNSLKACKEIIVLFLAGIVRIKAAANLFPSVDILLDRDILSPQRRNDGNEKGLL